METNGCAACWKLAGCFFFSCLFGGKLHRECFSGRCSSAHPEAVSRCKRLPGVRALVERCPPLRRSSRDVIGRGRRNARGTIQRVLHRAVGPGRLSNVRALRRCRVTACPAHFSRHYHPPGGPGEMSERLFLLRAAWTFHHCYAINHFPLNVSFKFDEKFGD